MEKIAFPIAIAAVLLVFNAKILSLPIAPPHPLCLQQFALANQACSLIPYDHAVPTSIDKPGIFTQVSNDSDEDDGDGDEGEEDGDEGEGDGDDDEGDDDDEDDGEDRRSGQDHGNRGGHGGSRRHHSPRASRGGNGNRNASGNGSTGSGGGGSGSRHGRRRGHGSGHRHHSDDKEGEEHGHRSRRRHRRHHSESRESSECCKWLEEVDASCVCDLLIRLPNFLRRPSHAIMIKVQDSCNVTYECPGRFLE